MTRRDEVEKIKRLMARRWQVEHARRMAHSLVYTSTVGTLPPGISPHRARAMALSVIEGTAPEVQ